MSFDPLTAALELGKTVIERVIPDPQQRAKAVLELEALAQKKDLETLNAKVKLMLAQIDVNKEQAKSKSKFIAGGRPFIIWVCGFGLTFQYLFHPLLSWAWAFADISGVPPTALDLETMMPLLLGLLGLGGYRSLDKYNRVQTDRID